MDSDSTPPRPTASGAPHNKPQAVSHMLWFFVLPSLVFLGWAGLRFTQGLFHPPSSNLEARLTQLRTAQRSGDRWQAAYELAQSLQKLLHGDQFSQLPTEQRQAVFETFAEILKDQKSDIRLRKYLFLTLGQLNDPQALPILEAGTQEEDPEARFYSAWSLAQILTRHPQLWKASHTQAALQWLTSTDTSLKNLAISFLAQDPTGSARERLHTLLSDSDASTRWNTAVALTSVGDTKAYPVLKDVFRIEVLRQMNFSQADELTQLLRGARDATEKSGDPSLHQAMLDLKDDANAQTPEGRAILRALIGVAQTPHN